MSTARTNWTSRQQAAFFGARNPHCHECRFWPAGTQYNDLASAYPSLLDLKCNIAIRRNRLEWDEDEAQFRHADIAINRAQLPALTAETESGDVGIIQDEDGNYWRLAQPTAENAALFRVAGELVTRIRTASYQNGRQ